MNIFSKQKSKKLFFPQKVKPNCSTFKQRVKWDEPFFATLFRLPPPPFIQRSSFLFSRLNEIFHFFVFHRNAAVARQRRVKRATVITTLRPAGSLFSSPVSCDFEKQNSRPPPPLLLLQCTDSCSGVCECARLKDQAPLDLLSLKILQQ